MNQDGSCSLELGKNCHFTLLSFRLEKVVDHAQLVNNRAGNHKEMPDGVGKRDASVTIEDDADDVDGAAEFQFLKIYFFKFLLTCYFIPLHLRWGGPDEFSKERFSKERPVPLPTLVRSCGW
jgi:hypothetical protein